MPCCGNLWTRNLARKLIPANTVAALVQSRGWMHLGMTAGGLVKERR